MTYYCKTCYHRWNWLLGMQTVSRTICRSGKYKLFRYDDICSLLQRYSINIEKDLQQLLTLMLFSRAIHNTDDHERNFSLINDGQGYCLSPAYDLVPSLVAGQYHAASFNHSVFPPRPSEVARLGKIFGLPKTTVAHCAEHVKSAIELWPYFAEQAGIIEQECNKIEKVFSK